MPSDLFEYGITSHPLHKDPAPSWWDTTGDGRRLVLLYNRVQEINGWFLFYFLVFAYFFRSVTVFWVQNEWFPFWVNSLAGEFCFYFVIYASVAVFISSLAYQAKYIFGNRRQK